MKLLVGVQNGTAALEKWTLIKAKHLHTHTKNQTGKKSICKTLDLYPEKQRIFTTQNHQSYIFFNIFIGI